MRGFNSSVSVVGITDIKVQQAVLKLLENCNALKGMLETERRQRSEEVRLLRQKIASIGGGQ